MKPIKAIIFILTVGGIAAGLFYFKEKLSHYPNIFLDSSLIEKKISGLIQQVEKQIFIPVPLIAEKDVPEAFLTQNGVILLVNEERAREGLPALKESQLLDQSAENKAEDMFLNQYFTHDSLDGRGVGDLAEEVGYDYLVIGENLAMGNFADDAALIRAWMDSPGHRANILNQNFQEIGVSVQKGIYQGKTTWLAVQHFGKPILSCTQPDSVLKIAVESSQNQLTDLKNNLDLLRSELRAMDKKNIELYNQKASEYNNLISQYNELIIKTKKIVDQYNEQVGKFNSCASGN